MKTKLNSKKPLNSRTRNRVLKFQNSFSLPLDPIKLKTMAEYNFALLNNRNWFEYEGGTKVIPSIIESWNFDKKTGEYLFTISPSAKWSDGSAITPDQLHFNLIRAIRFKSSYGKAISSIMDLGSFKVRSRSSFTLSTKNKKPSENFFERMGTVFLSIVHPKDVDPLTLKVKASTLSSGPYVITALNGSTLSLSPNLYYPQIKNAPQEIQLDLNPPPFDIERFLLGKSWENIAQLSSFVPKDWEEKIKQKHLPYWTRSHDRVSLLRPGFGKKLARGKKIIQAIQASFCEYPLTTKLPFNVTRAQSLQPAPYPLFHTPIKYGKKSFPKGEIKILTSNSAAFSFHKEILDAHFKKINVSVTWDEVPFLEYAKKLSNSKNHDIILVSFGVADPEPATWVSLINDAKFIHFSNEDITQFKKILNSTNNNLVAKKLRALLAKIMTEGGYVPIFYGSTLALAHKGISFENIRELDETINLSKIIFAR